MSARKGVQSKQKRLDWFPSMIDCEGARYNQNLFADVRCACPPHGAQLECRTVLTAGNFGAPMNAANKGAGSLQKFWRPGRRREKSRSGGDKTPRGLLASPRVLTCSLRPLSPKQSFVKCLSVLVGQLTLQLQAAAIYGGRVFHR